MRKTLTVATVLLALALTGCAPERHATVEDCVAYYLSVGKPGDVLLEACINIREDTTQEKFDELFLPEN